MTGGYAGRLALSVCVLLAGAGVSWAQEQGADGPRTPRERVRRVQVAPAPPEDGTLAPPGAPVARDVLALAAAPREASVDAPYGGPFADVPYPHWRVKLPGPVSRSAAHSERTRPLLVDGSVFVGSADGDALFELDRRNGSLLRSYPAAASVESEPVVGSDFVVFADTGGHVWCYGRDGTLAWSYDAAVPVLVAPVVAGGVVYVHTVDDLVVALGLQDGAQKWRYAHRTDIGRRTELALYAAPAVLVVDDQIITGFSDGALVGLSRAEGDIEWQVRVGEGAYPDIVAQPTRLGDVLFVSGYFDPLLALDLETLRRRWTADHGAAFPSALMRVVGRRTVEGGASQEVEADVLLHPGTDGVLRALLATTGDPLWSWSSGTDGALTTPVVTEAGVLVGSGSGTLVLLDPRDGTERWRYAPMFVVEGVASPVAVEGRQVVFVTQAGYLVSLLAPRQPVVREAVQPWTLRRPDLPARTDVAPLPPRAGSSPRATPSGGPTDASAEEAEAPPTPGDVESPR